MEIIIEFDIKIDMDSSNIENILKEFTRHIPMMFELFTGKVLNEFAEQFLANGTFAGMIGCSRVTKKTFKDSEITRISTPYGTLILP